MGIRKGTQERNSENLFCHGQASVRRTDFANKLFGRRCEFSFIFQTQVLHQLFSNNSTFMNQEFPGKSCEPLTSRLISPDQSQIRKHLRRCLQLMPRGKKFKLELKFAVRYFFGQLGPASSSSPLVSVPDSAPRHLGMFRSLCSTFFVLYIATLCTVGPENPGIWSCKVAS